MKIIKRGGTKHNGRSRNVTVKKGKESRIPKLSAHNGDAYKKAGTSPPKMRKTKKASRLKVRVKRQRSFPQNILEAARQYIRSGLSVLPIRADGSKAPAIGEWKSYQSRRPTGYEINEWFDGRQNNGIAIVSGAVSGNLEVLDFDEDAEQLFSIWQEMVEAECPGLIERLPKVATPNKGFHLRYRSSVIEGNRKVALRLKEVPEGTQGARKIDGKYHKVETLIETRGEGGYAIAPPSPAECHPLNKPYELLSGDLTNIPTVTPEEREVMINAARSLNEYIEPDSQLSAYNTNDERLNRPGDDFNRKGDWHTLLEEYGWRQASQHGEVEFWQRPDKDGNGHSATLNYRGNKLFHVFTTSAPPFEADRSYTLFTVYALLKHAGDYRAAARELAKQGYGEPIQEETATSHTKKSQASMLVELAHDAELFHTSSREAYATVPVNDHRETQRIESEDFKLWLSERFYRARNSVASSSAMEEANGIITAKAIFDGPTLDVHIRVAESNGDIYVDLGNERWEAIRITPDGYSIVPETPVRFRRPKGMLPLPYPADGGSVDELYPFLNLETDDDCILLVGWLVSAFVPGRPFAPLSITGEQGTAKSTLTRIIKGLVDPNTVPLKAIPNEKDLMIAARNSHVLAFDNLSRISRETSDALCRLATGGGYATRKLYTDDDEVLFEVMRPIILNGIDELASKEDLVDRYLSIKTAAIPKDKRLRETELWKKFEVARPRILGALLSLVGKALKFENSIVIQELPRMADFVTLATAALGDDFLNAYRRNREIATALVLEASPLASAIITLMKYQKKWAGAPKQLLETLEDANPSVIRHYDWPKDASWLSRKLNRIAANMRAIGINIIWSKSGERRITIQKEPINNKDSDPDGKGGIQSFAGHRKPQSNNGLDGKDGKDGISSKKSRKKKGSKSQTENTRMSRIATKMPPIPPIVSNSNDDKHLQRTPFQDVGVQDVGTVYTFDSRGIAEWAVDQYEPGFDLYKEYFVEEFEKYGPDEAVPQLIQEAVDSGLLVQIDDAYRPHLCFDCVEAVVLKKGGICKDCGEGRREQLAVIHAMRDYFVNETLCPICFSSKAEGLAMCSRCTICTSAAVGNYVCARCLTETDRKGLLCSECKAVLAPGVAPDGYNESPYEADLYLAKLAHYRKVYCADCAVGMVEDTGGQLCNKCYHAYWAAAANR
jgi:hypothetical protein